ncbi:hypothetical protein [Agromyces soli]|uniref:Secreted protein n=1 Tax=Agromyces soli TaxID=659012 RepID=A0ABY4AU37_9MICO|nr:hypothetical protein [Agromyces soli]UOE26389.1 hypothetical protein MTP13_00995 [Agromyces soli]
MNLKARRRRIVGSAILASLLSIGGVVVTAVPAEAACSGVSNPRVRYWCNTVAPNTVYYSTDGSYKKYNEMYEGGSLLVGIRWQIPGGATWGAYNGTGYVYKTYAVSTTDLATCWNRSTSTYSSARCDFVKG